MHTPSSLNQYRSWLEEMIGRDLTIVEWENFLEVTLKAAPLIGLDQRTYAEGREEGLREGLVQTMRAATTNYETAIRQKLTVLSEDTTQDATQLKSSMRDIVGHLRETTEQIEKKMGWS